MFDYKASPCGDLERLRRDAVAANAQCDYKGKRVRTIPLLRTDGTYAFLHWDNRHSRRSIAAKKWPKSGEQGCIRPQPRAMDDDMSPYNKYYAGMPPGDRELMHPCRVPLPPAKDQQSTEQMKKNG